MPFAADREIRRARCAHAANRSSDSRRRAEIVLAALAASSLLLASLAAAGPPYVTDDPEPVAFEHFEIYAASFSAHDPGGWSGSAPFVELNYGALPDLQLHLGVPAAYALPDQGESHYGLGDVELGAKYRFVQEGEWTPQVATYPTFVFPTGDEHDGLGSGALRLLLPLWIQKSLGPWTTYGGFGYWLDWGAGRRGSWFVGWQLQRRLSPHFTVGAEVFHMTPNEAAAADETRFNVGLVVDITEVHHVLLSAGRGIDGPNRFQGYLGYQLVFGLEGAPER